MGKVLKQLAQDMADADRLKTERGLERELSKTRSQLAIAEQKLRQSEAELEHAESRIDFVQSLRDPLPDRYEFKPRKVSGSATAGVNFGDWHVEEEVRPETIGGLNEYNLEIAARRIKRVTEKAVMWIGAARTMSNIKDLVIGLLGDFITGYIHEELMEGNLLSPTEACLFAQDHIVSSIDYLAKHSGCKSITVVTCHGNHGRTTQRPRCATAAENSFEWLMYKQLEKYYRNNPRIAWKVETGYFNYLDVQGKRIGFQHGDWIRYSGGVGGIEIPTNKAIAAWNRARPCAHHFAQHWHQRAGNRYWTIGNCMIGYNAFAQSIKAEFSEPSQTFWVVDRDRPKPVIIEELYCD